MFCLRDPLAFVLKSGGPWSCVSESEELLGIVCIASEGYRTILGVSDMLERTSSSVAAGHVRFPSYRLLFLLTTNPRRTERLFRSCYAMGRVRMYGKLDRSMRFSRRVQILPASRLQISATAEVEAVERSRACVLENARMRASGGERREHPIARARGSSRTREKV